MSDSLVQLRTRRLFPFILLAVAMLIVWLYASSSWRNGFIYDDHEVIENQYPIHSASDLRQIFREPHYLNFPYYRPVTRTTFAIQKTIWGDSPLAFHLFNSILAGIVMLAAYALLRRPRFGLPPVVALLAAAWFSVHPTASECVYPAASGRETLLAALFILLAMWAYLHEGIQWFCAAMLLFIVAILCKEQAVVMPAAFFLADITSIGAFAISMKRAKTWMVRYIPPAIIVLAYFALRYVIFGKSMLQGDLVRHPLLPLLSMLYGLQTTIAPFMVLKYEPTETVWFSLELSIIAVTVAIAILIVASRSSSLVRRAGLFWVGWFFLLQLPTAHLLKQDAAFSERYVFLSMLALPAMIGAILNDRLRTSTSRMAAVGVAAAWIAILSRISGLRAVNYINDQSFVVQWLQSDPSSASAHYGAGLIAQSQGDVAAAVKQYRIALSIDPNSVTAHNNLANLLADRREFAEAAQHYEWVLRTNLKDATVLTNYGRMLAEQGAAQRNMKLFLQAQGVIERAIAIKPRYARAHYELALCRYAVGDTKAAISQVQIALELQPGWPEARKMLEKLTAAPPTTRR